MRGEPVLSVVIPLYNEEETIAALHARVSAVLDGLDLPADVILVDDGSADATVRLALDIVETDQRFRLVQLSRNFGHQTAITAGIDLAEGEAVVIMDGDLQDPPEVIPDMVRRWREGYHVVYGVRAKRDADTAFKRISARGFYRTLDRLTDIQVPSDAGDFRLLDRAVVDALGQVREGDRYLRGIIAWLGFDQTEVPYERPPREAGETKFPLRKMVAFALDGIVGFSVKPLRWAATLGFAISALAFLIGFLAVFQKIVGIDTLVPGWASTLSTVAFFSGIQLMILGVLGTYIGQIHRESRQRPLYVVRELHNFADDVTVPSRAVLPPVPRADRPVGVPTSRT